MPRNHHFPYDDAALDHLRSRCKALGRVIDRIGPIQRPVNPNIFEALVSSIVSQQISGKAAETVWKRVNLLVGDVDPVRILATDPLELQQCGMSHKKVSYIRGIAEAAADGSVDFSRLHEWEDEEVIRQLSSLKGVGVWTAEMLLIFSLARPDVVSYGDLAIRRGMMQLYRLDDLTRAQFLKYRKRYSPHGSLASLYLWELAGG